MTDRGARRLAWAAFGLWLAFIAMSTGLSIATELDPGASGASGDILFSLSLAAFPIVGFLILARQPRNTIAWILVAIGFLWAEPSASYGDFALTKGLPGGAISAAIASPLWAPAIGLMGTFVLLRFPNGKLLSPRWKKVEWLSAVAIAVTTVTVMFGSDSLEEYGNIPNPLFIESLEPLFGILIPVILLIPVTILASAGSLVLRFRRSTGTERLQVKWLATAAAVIAVFYLAAML